MKHTCWLMAAAVSIGGCSMKADLGATADGVERFHHQLDAGRYDAIAAAAGPEMRAAANGAMLVPILRAVHTKLGAVRSTTRTGFNDSINGNGHFATVTYRTTFDRGQGQETFTFRVADKAVALIGYNINSPVLILN